MKKIKQLLAIFLFTTNLISCIKEPEPQVEVNPNDEREYYDGSESFMEQELGSNTLLLMKDFGINLNFGSTPPNIDIICQVEPFILQASNVPGDNIGSQFDSYVLWFDNFSSKTNRVDYGGGHYGLTSHKDNGDGAYIAGTGNLFTLFLVLESELFGHPTDVAMVISGEKEAGGIKDLELLYIMLDDKGDPNGNIIENQTGRFLYDEDLFSKKIDRDTYFGY